MKLHEYGFGTCGMEQAFCAGTVKFDTDGAAAGVVLRKLPNNIVVTRAVAEVTTAFSANATLSVGAGDGANDILATSDVTATTAGAYTKQTFVKLERGAEVKVKLGGSPTAGEADIYLFFVSLPD